MSSTANFEVEAKASSKSKVNTVGVGIELTSKRGCEYPVVLNFENRFGFDSKEVISIDSFITAIDGFDTRLLGESKCLKMLEGPVGTFVELKVLEGGKARTIKLERKANESATNRLLRIGSGYSCEKTFELLGRLEKRKIAKDEFEVPFLLKGIVDSDPLLIKFIDKASRNEEIPASLEKEIDGPWTKLVRPKIKISYESKNSLAGRYFKVSSIPTFIFIGSPNQILKDGKDIVRVKLRKSELLERMKKAMIDSYEFQDRRHRVPFIPGTIDTRFTEDQLIRMRLRKRL